jgi:hypothetical protein
MMKVRVRSLVIAAWIASALATSVLISACAEPPTEEMETARIAVTRAENDPDVAIYAVSALARAREALANMEAEAEAKRYDAARDFATAAQDGAERAIADARTVAARARDDSTTALNALRAAVEETDATIVQGKKNGLALDWGQIDGDYQDAQSIAGEAEARASAGRYRDAVERANTARTTLSSINARISGASLAVTRKK